MHNVVSIQKSNFLEDLERIRDYHLPFRIIHRLNIAMKSIIEIDYL
jgi:hypothetical protein